MDPLVHRPAGDLLEEIVGKGAEGFPRYLGHAGEAPRTYRLAVLLGGLSLGPGVVEAVREHLGRRESPEKWAVVRGLGELGHPEAEGYFARVLRERASADAMAVAVRCLGRIRGEKTLPLVLGALEQPLLVAEACGALGRYGTPEAVAALAARAEEFPAFQALARLGAADPDRLTAALGRGAPWTAAAAQGLGLRGDPAQGERLLPLLASRDREEARAAFEAYARLGAPQGVAPLLQAAGRGLEAWSVEALGALGDPEAHGFLLAALAPPRPAGFWRRLLGGTKPGYADRRGVFRAVRGATDPGVLDALTGWLTAEDDPVALRELLGCRGLAEGGRGEALAGAWRGGGLTVRYAAARALLQAPSGAFLAEALDCLGQPGLLSLDGAPASTDPARVLEVLARDENPFLLLGGFLDSGLADLETLEADLAARLGTWSFPGEGAAARDGAGGAFLGAFGDARPGVRRDLGRLWTLLGEVTDRGDPLVELFLCHGGAHRGGLQRMLLRAFPAAVARFVQGRGDRHLPELDAVAAHLPTAGPAAASLGGVLDGARRALMAECRDIALLVEGSQRGDVVLIEAL